MPLQIRITIQTPLTDEDRDLLTGLSLFTMTAATRVRTEEKPEAPEETRPFQAVLFALDNEGNIRVHEPESPEELDDIVARVQENIRRCEGMSVTGLTQCILAHGHDGLHTFADPGRVN